MYLSSLTILVFTSPDAGMLPIRSAPVDRC
jgi:hypothetical protein